MNDQYFDDALELLRRLEGGYVNDSRDRGGETKYGISQKSYPQIDIKNLTWEGAAQIYKRDFWDRCRYGLLNDRRFARRCFEQSVNGGPATGVLLLQRAYNELHPGALPGLLLAEDGILGPKTAGAVNGYRYPSALYFALLCQARDRYQKCQGKETYLQGWYNRLVIE